MDILEILIPALAIAIIFLIPFAFFAFVRYLRYKETIALAERGLLRPERRRRNRDTLRWGIIITMLGLGLLCGLWPLGFMSISSGPAQPAPLGESGVSTPPFGIGPWLVLGLLPLFFGLALIIIHWVNQREEVEEDDEEAIPRHKQVELGKEDEK